jgi:hypothetical protein
MENPDGVQSRIFIIVAIGLVGLLMIGLLSIAGLVVYTRFLAPAASPTTVAVASPTQPSVAGATPTLPAAPGVTPVGPAPTPTLVVQPAASPAPGEATPAPTATPTGEEEIPDTGFGPLEAVVGGVILLLIILFVRRLRFTGQT